LRYLLIYRILVTIEFVPIPRSHPAAGAWVAIGLIELESLGLAAWQQEVVGPASRQS